MNAADIPAKEVLAVNEEVMSRLEKLAMKLPKEEQRELLEINMWFARNTLKLIHL